MSDKTLKLDLSGDEELVNKFELAIISLLELGKNWGLIKYEINTRFGDHVDHKCGDLTDDIKEVVAEKIERQSRMAVRLTDVEREQIRKFKLEGKSTKQISKEMDVSEHGVYRVLKSFGMTQPAPPSVTDKQRLMMEELHHAGISIKKISKSVGVNSVTVARHLEKMGLHKIISRKEKAEMDAIVERTLRTVSTS